MSATVDILCFYSHFHQQFLTVKYVLNFRILKYFGLKFSVIENIN